MWREKVDVAQQLVGARLRARARFVEVDGLASAADPACVGCRQLLEGSPVLGRRIDVVSSGPTAADRHGRAAPTTPGTAAGTA